MKAPVHFEFGEGLLFHSSTFEEYYRHNILKHLILSLLVSKNDLISLVMKFTASWRLLLNAENKGGFDTEFYNIMVLILIHVYCRHTFKFCLQRLFHQFHLWQLKTSS